MANSIDPDKMAPTGAISSGSMLFAVSVKASLGMNELISYLTIPWPIIMWVTVLTFDSNLEPCSEKKSVTTGQLRTA